MEILEKIIEIYFSSEQGKQDVHDLWEGPTGLDFVNNGAWSCQVVRRNAYNFRKKLKRLGYKI